MEGCNAIILAYGQTGTGKTLTISGLQNTFQDRGIALRIIADIFQLKQTLKGKHKVCIQISYIETVRQHVVDLLNRSDKGDHTVLSNLTVIKVKNIYNAMKIIFKAEGRRHMLKGSHGGNGLLTIHVISKPLNVISPEIRVSKLHLVDLAGVDIYGNATSLYKTVFEVGGANTAKSQLEQFMLILSQNNPNQIKVKHRLNPLIQYLSDSLNGRSILRYIGHIRIDLSNLLITTSIFRFGQIVRGLRPLKLHKNIIEDKEAMYTIMKEELRKSKIEKDLEVMMASQDLSSNLTQDRIKHMQNVAQEYLHNNTNEIVLMSVSDAKTVLQVFKNLYNKLENEKNEFMKAAIERASEDARSLQKSENNTSSRNVKRSSKSLKSKESLTTGSRVAVQAKTHKKSEKNDLSPTPSQIKAVEKGKESPRASIKRSRTSSFIKKSGSRRKSGTSTTSIGTDPNEQILQNVNLPDAVPYNRDAWNEFIVAPEYLYQDLLNTLESYEIKAREMRIVYLDEVKKLQVLFDMVDLRKDELQRVQMQRLLNKEEHNTDGTLIISDNEKHCLENLKKAHEELVAQQEQVLKNQSLYRIAIESYINAKKTINEKFQLFCQEKYNAPVPPIDLEFCSPFEEIQEETIITAVSLDPKAVDNMQIQKSAEALQYEELKLIMKSRWKKH